MQSCFAATARIAQRSAITILILTTAATALTGCIKPPEPPSDPSAEYTPVIDQYVAYRQFQQEVGQRLTDELLSAPGVANLHFILLPMTMRAGDPIGTVTLPDAGPLSVIDRTSCLFTPQPSSTSFPGLDNTSFDLSRSVAANLGIDKAIGMLAEASVKYANTAKYKLKLTDVSLRFPTRSELKSVLSDPKCQSRDKGGTQVMVVGYLMAKRDMQIQLTSEATTKFDIKKLVSLGGKWDPGNSTWTQTDDHPEPLTVILTALSPETEEASSAPASYPPPSMPQSSPEAQTQTQTQTQTLEASVQRISSRAKLNIQADPRAFAIARHILSDVQNNPYVLKKNVKVVQFIDTQPKIPSQPLVRVFRDDDVEEAESLSALVKNYYPNSKVRIDVFSTPILPGSGQVEIWLPNPD